MIDFLFALLNLAIFLGILTYLFIKSLPLIKQAIEGERAVESDLHDENQAVVLMQRRVHESTATQEEECNRLFIKIDQWKRVVDSAANQKAQERLRDQKELEEKIAHQSEQYGVEQMYKKLAPAVTAELEAFLKAYYSDPKKAHEYVDRFIEGLKK